MEKRWISRLSRKSGGVKPGVAAALIIASAILFIAFLMVRSIVVENAYRFPSDTLHRDLAQPLSEKDANVFHKSVENIVRSWVRHPDRPSASLLIAQDVMTLQDSAQSQTFELLSKKTGLSQGEVIDAETAHKNVLAILAQSKGFRAANGLFMIWPILLSTDYQDRTIQNFGTDVVRLGSAGMGAEIAVKLWFGRQAGFKPTDFHLGDKSIQMMFVQGMSFVGTVQGGVITQGGQIQAPAETVGSTQVVRLQDDWLLTLTPRSDGEKLAEMTSPEDWGLKGQPSAQILFAPPRFAEAGSFADSFANLGLAAIQSSPQDYRTMSVEMDHHMVGRFYRDWRFSLVPDGTAQPAPGQAKAMEHPLMALWHKGIPAPIFLVQG